MPKEDKRFLNQVVLQLLDVFWVKYLKPNQKRFDLEKLGAGLKSKH